MLNERIIKECAASNKRISEMLTKVLKDVYKVYPKPEKLVTPDGIWFDSRGILFPNKKQVLLYAQGVYKIHSPLPPRQNLPLTPCEWKDLKPGDVYFGTRRVDMTEYTALCCYRIKLDEVRSVYIGDDEDITVETFRYNYNYKVGL